MNIFPVSTRLAGMQAYLEDSEGELTEDQYDEYMCAVGDLETAVFDTAAQIRNLEAEADALKKAENEITERRWSFKDRADRLKGQVIRAADLRGQDRFKNELFTISVRNSPPSLNIDGSAKIPPKFLVPQPPVVDRTSLKLAIQGGETIEGCTLESGRNLQIIIAKKKANGA